MTHQRLAPFIGPCQTCWLVFKRFRNGIHQNFSIPWTLSRVDTGLVFCWDFEKGQTQKKMSFHFEFQNCVMLFTVQENGDAWLKNCRAMKLFQSCSDFVQRKQELTQGKEYRIDTAALVYKTVKAAVTIADNCERGNAMAMRGIAVAFH